MKIISWNVNGIRAAIKKDFFPWLAAASPDILCLQETKAHVDQLPETLLRPEHYETLWSSGERKGYSGVATFTKPHPLAVHSYFGYQSLDGEGRILLTEYPDFFLFNVYFPNGGSGEERLKYKLAFYESFLRIANEMRSKGKGVIICGDINTAHNPIDLARPKENEHVSGFMRIERDWLDMLMQQGYIDTFRHFHPDQKDTYSWWDMKTGARTRNVGWRIDYFVVSSELKDRVKDAFILSDVMGSDHCPVGITFE
ncbi:exodeoxyribonuclease III [Candidatus Gracilibacteria bacterium]|nr:exodeoxyribonuclease III [Candidatus Gracilibacteria bacterium]